MFRRSIQILLAATLLALAAVVGYASLRLSGAPEALAEAEQLVRRQEYARAIAVLDLCERGRSLQQDPVLRERLWRLRLSANAAIDNHRGALLDIANLLRERGDGDLDLELERIRLLVATGEGAQARQLARQFVAANDQHGQGLELAGAACAEAYRLDLARLQGQIERDLGAGQTEAGRTALATYLFRPDGDAEVAPAIEALAALYQVDARLAARWLGLLRELRALRTDVQEGLDYCRRSLELPGDRSTALVQWATALDAGGRSDDMLVACEIQRRRTDDAHTADAGLVAATALLRRQANSAAVATVGRWLPSTQLQPRIDAGRLGDAVPDLVLARILAAWRLRDAAALHRTLADLQLLQRNEVKIPVALHTAAGMLHYLNQTQKESVLDQKNGENNLRYVVGLLQREPQGNGLPDLLDVVVPLRLDLMQKLGVAEAEQLLLFDTWQKARPDALAPKVAFVQHLLARRQLPAAQAVLVEAIAAHPTDEQLFDLRLAIARADDSQPGQDGRSLLAQCLSRRSSTPEVLQPIGYLLCAEAALEKGAWRIARDSAQLAIDAFPQLRKPRLVAIEATLGAQQALLAAQLVRQLFDLFPLDERTARLALRAHRAADLPTAPLLATVLPACSPAADVRIDLLRVALADDPATAEAFAAPVIGDTKAPAMLRLLAARALAIAGRPVDCRRLLDSVIGEIDALPAEARPDLAQAMVAWIASAARWNADAALLTEVRRMLARTQLRGEAAAPVLLQSAGELAATHPRCAYELLVRGLAIADPATRTGAVHALAGRLALQQRQLRLAEEHWLAALAFADGQEAAEALARLHLAQGRAERCVQVYQLVEAATDAALAARCSAHERAAALAEAAAQRDAADLLAQATLAAIGLQHRTDWQVADAPATDLRLEVLTLLQAPDLGPEALSRARMLAAAEPDSATTRLLLARACLLAGEAAEAASIHLELRTRAPSPLLWREVALATEHADYVLDAALDGDLGAAMAGDASAGSPTTLTVGLQRMAAAFDRAGYPEVANATRASLWQQLPDTTVTTDVDVEGVAAMANTTDAWRVLDRVLPQRSGSTRALARTRLYELGTRLVAEQGRAAVDVYLAAGRHADQEGAFGCIVHFLLDHGSVFPAHRPDARRTRQLLLAQLELAGAGKDPGPWLQRTVERLLREQGVAATRDDVQATLQRHPTSLPLWHARATVLARTRDGHTGITDLRRVLAHAEAPSAVLDLLVLAAAEGALDDGDPARLAALPPALLATADGMLARGLVALRGGQPDDAVSWLASAPARADGLHLFASALANLQSRAVEGATRARDAFLKLSADYPSSSLARHAGSFAAQLAPR